MSNVRRFAALNTKIKSMVGKLLSKEDYQNMLLMNNESEIFDYLNESTYYANIFKDIEEDQFTIANVEFHIKNYIITLYKKINCFITGDYQKLFRLLMKRFEAEDIKTYLRTLILKQDVSELYLDYPNASFYSRLDYKTLSQSSDLSEFVDCLQDTIYYKVLKLYLDEAPERMLFYMEMNIDRVYFSKLSVEIARFKGDERPIFDILQMNIDFLNFQWIYRGRKFYNLSPEEVLNYTLPNGHYLNYDMLKTLSYTDDEIELFEIMAKTHYKKLFEHDEQTELFLERDMDRYLYKHFLKSERESSLNMVTVVAFTHRLEFEMRDLFTMIEAKHYGVSSHELKEYLIRVI